MKFRLPLIILSFLTACTSDNHPINTYSNKVEMKTIKELQTQYELKVRSVGGSAMRGVTALDLGFEFPHALSLEEARRLLVSSVEVFLKNINSDTDLRPFLVEYPFPASRISFSINTQQTSPSSKQVLDSVTTCMLVRGRIEYSIIDNGIKKTLLKESYEDAKRKINEKTI